MKAGPKVSEFSGCQSRDCITRRALLKGGVLALTAIMLPGNARAAEALAQVSDPEPRLRPPAGDAWARSLAFYNVHTGEALRVVYFENAEYVARALQEVNYFFRDYRTNQVKAIDPRLLDLLCRIHAALDTSNPFNLISGYRSPATNEWLAGHGEGVSHHSLHMQGRASDINVDGRSLAELQRVALAMKGGGVGFYPRSNFVHVDTGRVRHW